MQHHKIQRLAGMALLSALVVILQLLGQFIRFGPVSVTLVLVPIVVGAAVYGPSAGALLGGVFSIVVLLQPDTLVFHSASFVGTVMTVMAKGVLAGWLAGLVFAGLASKNGFLAVIAAAVICPIVNTAVFSLGCRIFFWDLVTQWGGGKALLYLVTVMIGGNFLAELGANIVCAPIILRILRIVRKN